MFEIVITKNNGHSSSMGKYNTLEEAEFSLDFFGSLFTRTARLNPHTIACYNTLIRCEATIKEVLEEDETYNSL